jgi:pimeloyl-ACP methyl ester carboxylesterase
VTKQVRRTLVSTAKQRETGYADVNGARLYYEVAGTGNPVIFSHAGIADHRMWNDQFEAFAQRYRVIRYDHRGMGQSSMPAGPFSLREDIYGLGRFLGADRAYVIGCSMGGSAALDCALAHPDFVDALVLVDSGMSGEQWTPEDEAEGERIFGPIGAAVERGDIDAANEMEVKIWVDGLRRTPEQVNPAVRKLVLDMNLNMFKRAEEFKRGEAQPLDPPAAGRLHEVRCPTLVIVGDEDLPFELRTADTMAAGIPNARKVVIHDAAHLPSMEKPEEFNRIVLDFLASLGR